MNCDGVGIWIEEGSSFVCGEGEGWVENLFVRDWMLVVGEDLMCFRIRV